MNLFDNFSPLCGLCLRRTFFLRASSIWPLRKDFGDFLKLESRMVCDGFGESCLGNLCSLAFVNWPWWRGQVKGLFSENWPAFLTAFEWVLSAMASVVVPSVQSGKVHGYGKVFDGLRTCSLCWPSWSRFRCVGYHIDVAKNTKKKHTLFENNYHISTNSFRP